MGAESESIRALATVTLDAAALEGLGPRTIDRLADLVAARLAERHAVGEAPLLTTAQAAAVAGVHPDTVRRAIRSGALNVAGYVGQRPRLRRPDVDAWVRAGEPQDIGAVSLGAAVAARRRRPGRSGHARVLGDALRRVAEGGGRS